VADQTSATPQRVSEPIREAVTMTLYVCVVLVAEFVTVGQELESERAAVGVIWGTTVGLALAHVFAFNLAARLLVPEAGDQQTRAAAWAQLGAAAVVAAVVSLPLLVWSLETALDVGASLAAALVGLTAYLAARNAGAGRFRAIVEGAVVLAIAAALVGVKAWLAH
jgi:hypothetical protein